MRTFPLFVFLALALVFAFMLLRKTEPAALGSASNTPLPAITVTALEGNARWNPAALQGRVTLINFFASWCTPCAAEMPELAALHKQFPALHIEGVAWNDQPDTLRPWLKKNGNPYRMLWFDKNGEATIALGIKGIPESFVVDAKGMVRYHLTGPLTAEMRQGDFGALIEGLIAEAAHAK